MKAIKHFFCFVLTLLFLLTIDAYSQTVKSTVDKDSITIGDQIKLTLKLDDLNPKQFYLIRWFDFIDSLQHFKLVEKSRIDTLLFNGLYHFRQSFLITSFDSGVYIVPPFTVQLKNIFSEEDVELSTSAIYISISPVNVANLKTYNDVTEIIPVNENTDIPNYYIIAIVITCILITGVAIWLYKRRNKVTHLSDTGVKSVFEDSMQQLDALENSLGNKLNSPKESYNKLYHIVRFFYSRRFHEPSVISCTTNEWILLSEKIKIGKEEKEEFGALLHKSDEVRFTENIHFEEFKESISIAKKIINYLNQLK